jgi:hypothetical protein
VATWGNTVKSVVGAYLALLGLVLGNQPAISVRISARLSSAKCAFLSRLGATRRAMDGEGVFCAAFLFLHSHSVLEHPLENRETVERIS